MTDSDRQIIMMGLPSTGKTTFLAALWEVITSGGGSGLRLQRLYEGDRSHITARHEEWLACKPVQRTVADQQPVSLSLTRPTDGADFRLVIPDMSGETYRVQFEQRRWGVDFDERIRSTTAFMVFVRPMMVEEPTPVAVVAPALRELPDGSQRDMERSGLPGRRVDDWTNASCCTQVKYVDLLQFISHAKRGLRIRVAVIVSAIDELDGTPLQNDPEGFICKKFSLLDQFLRANPQRFEVRIYGVSAQGAEYSQKNLVALRSRKTAAQRIRVLGNGVDDSDIARPLNWLSFGVHGV